MKIGDIVERKINVGGQLVPMMRLTITAIRGDRIICGAWEFDKNTGAEIDEDLGWGPTASGSFIFPLAN